MSAGTLFRAIAAVLAVVLASRHFNRSTAFVTGVLAGVAVFGARIAVLPTPAWAALLAACLVALVAVGGARTWSPIVGDGLTAGTLAAGGAAGLVRYRASIDDPKEAGVLLVSLAVGLASGAGLFAVALTLCAFVIVVMWILESLEPPDRAQFNLVIESKDSLKIRQQVEHAFRGKGMHYQLWASSPDELRYEVSVPFDQDIKKLAKIIKRLDGHAASVEWEIKKFKTVRT